MREETVTSKRIYAGRVVTLDVLDVQREDGLLAMREIVRHAPAVGVLPLLPDGSFLFVRQFRKAIERQVIEICAGLVEPGEVPEAAARRELAEETGCRALSLHRLGALYSSPGFTDEVADVYIAECDVPTAPQQLDGDEHVEVLRRDRAGVEAWIREGTLSDAKSVAAWHLFTVWAAARATVER